MDFINIHFLLTPDRTSARFLRREVAKSGARACVLVGTWIELTELARKTYFVPEIEDSWAEQLERAAKSLTDAFWSKSLEVAEAETLKAVGHALAELLEGTDPEFGIKEDLDGVLPDRARKHLTDLVRLHKFMGETLPTSLRVIHEVLKSTKEKVTKGITVYYLPESQSLSPWQEALLEKLKNDSSSLRDTGLAEIQATAYKTFVSDEGVAALSSIQKYLFEPDIIQVKLDKSLQWLSARDYLEEVEIVAGMVQKALKEEVSLSMTDIGILVPADRNYSTAIRNVFTEAGLTLSGLSVELPVRDIGGEVVLHFLLCRRRPAPVMALAALLSSPLMPWTLDVGKSFARMVIDGQFDLETSSPKDSQMLKVIRKVTETPDELIDALKAFASLLTAPDGYEQHAARARLRIDQLISLVKQSKKIGWEELKSLAATEHLTQKENLGFFLEGIAIFNENEEPWRKVKKLFVLGFGSGHYPLDPYRSAVFSDSDIALLIERLGYKIDTSADVVALRRRIFKRQINAATESISFLIPCRNAIGEAIAPSQTLAFMARHFKGVNNIEDIILDLDSEAGRNAVIGLAVAPESAPVPPREIRVADLDFGRDLFAIRAKDDGTLRPESPSSLERLMVCPFAWLLNKAGLEPIEWVPESLDVASKGTIAHEVFELLFNKDNPLPDAKRIRSEVPKFLNETVMKLMPFLLAPEWHVERLNLETEIINAALHWREILIQVKARIIDTEVFLKGKLDDLPIHGKADLLLELQDGKHYIVDYKKSKSDLRRERMRKGFDSQTSLYRMMLEAGGEPRTMGDKEAFDIFIGKKVGVLYYMLNDQTALTDSSGWIPKSVAKIEELGTDISQNAISAIRSRIQESKSGTIKLNREDEEKWYEKNAGINAAYSFNASPLIRLFMHPAEENGQ